MKPTNQINTTKQVMSAIDCGSYIAYDNYREAHFQNWCKKYAGEMNLSLRVLVTHDGLRNWYQDQWIMMVERPFVKMYGDQFNSTDPEIKETLAHIFFTYAPTLEQIWPSGLLKMIKKETHEITTGRYKQMQQS